MELSWNEPDDLKHLVDRMMWKLERASESLGDEELAFPSNGRLATDVIDRGDRLEITVDAPGFSREDVDLRLTDRTLRVEARREAEEEAGDDDYFRRERSRRSMRREIRLPVEVDPGAVEARMENGVLTVEVGKSESAGGRKIEIE